MLRKVPITLRVMWRRSPAFGDPGSHQHHVCRAGRPSVEWVECRLDELAQEGTLRIDPIPWDWLEAGGV